jgi:hypothetical protein
MNRFWPRIVGIAVGAIVVSVAVLLVAVLSARRASGHHEPPADEASLSYDQLMSRVRLIPIDEKAREFYAGGPLGAIDESEDKLLADVTKRRDFARWKRFEDGLLSFEYPDDPHIVLEIKSPKDKIPVSGDPVRSEGYSFTKAYRLAVGKHTYCLLMVEKTDSFDDSVCFCGEEVFQKYLFLNGAMYRFSLLADGQIKKIQALGNGVRVVLLEWTHSAMPQEVYAKTALSIRLKAPVADRAAMTKKIRDEYGGIGFLESGMPRLQVVELLGKPTTENGSALTYVQTKERWRTTTTIPLRNGAFQCFGRGWRTSEKLPPERGTVEWIVSTVEQTTDYTVSGSARQPPPSKADVDYIFKRFLEIGPKAKDEDWNLLCRAIYGLRKAGHEDKRVLPIVRRRFLEPDVDQHYAAWLLDGYDSQGSRDLFAQRIRLTLDESRRRNAKNQAEDEYLIVGPYADLHNLLCFLRNSHPKFVSLLLDALSHPCARIRSDAYFFWDCLPDEKARSYLLKGLEDTDDGVRRWASSAFADKFGSKGDLAALRKRSAVERDDETRSNLNTAISRLERAK